MKWGRWIVVLLMVLAACGIWWVLKNPVSGTFHRLVMLAAGTVFLAGLVFIFWRIRGVRFGLFAIPSILLLLLVLPGREIDRDELRGDYVRNMSAFEGTVYFWGGESRLGIDCSGLPRRAYRDAMLAYGVRNLNGAAVRGFVEQWWFDTSARALGEGYRDFTVPLGLTGKISEMDYSDLEKGDLAVTVGGLHVLAYSGDGRWIQADPGIGQVATLDGRRDKNNWFNQPVTIHRWSVLDKR